MTSPSRRPSRLPGLASLRAVAATLAPPGWIPRRTGNPFPLAMAGVLAFTTALGGARLWKQHAPTTHHGLQAVITSGTAGFKAGPDGSPERWGGGAVTVYLDASVEKTIKGGPDAIERGFGTWLAAGRNLPALRFDTTHGAKPSMQADGKSTVMIADIPFAGHKKDLAITIGFVDDTGRMVEADIVLNARYRWTVLETHDGDDDADDTGTSCSGPSHAASCGDRYDVQDIATHEIGHFFGLGEDNDDATATMFKCSNACEIHKRELKVDDRSAIGTLYATALDGAPPGGASCDIGRGRPGSAGWLMVCLGVAAGVVRRRRG